VIRSTHFLTAAAVLGAATREMNSTIGQPVVVSESTRLCDYLFPRN